MQSVRRIRGQSPTYQNRLWTRPALSSGSMARKLVLCHNTQPRQSCREAPIRHMWTQAILIHRTWMLVTPILRTWI